MPSLPNATATDPLTQSVDTAIGIDSAMYNDLIKTINTPQEVTFGVSFNTANWTNGNSTLTTS